MTPRQIYLEAARRIADEGALCCCWPLWELDPHRRTASEFASLFKPTQEEMDRGGFNSSFWLEKDAIDPDAPHRRVVALCLMAAICSK